MKKILELLTTPWRMYKARRDFKKRMEKLRQQDPFIYK
jgi:hypothetical protein